MSQNPSIQTFTKIFDQFRLQVCLYNKKTLKINVRQSQNFKVMYVPEKYFIRQIQNMDGGLENQMSQQINIKLCQAIPSYVLIFNYEGLPKESKVMFKSLESFYEKFQEKQIVNVQRNEYKGFQVRFKIDSQVDSKTIRILVPIMQFSRIQQNIQQQQEKKQKPKRVNKGICMSRNLILSKDKTASILGQKNQQIKYQGVSLHQADQLQEKNIQQEDSNILNLSAQSAFSLFQSELESLQDNQSYQNLNQSYYNFMYEDDFEYTPETQ